MTADQQAICLLSPRDEAGNRLQARGGAGHRFAASESGRMQGLARSIVAVPEALVIEVIHTQRYQKVLGKLTMQYEMVVFQTVWDSRTAKIKKNLQNQN